MQSRDYIKSLHEVGLCLQALIKSRLHKNVKLIFTDGKYNSLYLSCYYRSHAFQFYVQDRNGLYTIYLLKDEKILKKDNIFRTERVERFYQKMTYFFRLIY